MTTTEQAVGDPPMWCDDFDMDLPKILPEAKSLLGDTADVTLWTHGHTTHGRLNHPSVWNGDTGMVAFFGFRTPQKPEVYWTSSPLVRCTFWEAVRDAWVHSMVMLVEGKPVLDTNRLWPDFEDIMWDVRGWRPHNAAAICLARKHVRDALLTAAGRLRRLRAA